MRRSDKQLADMNKRLDDAFPDTQYVVFHTDTVLLDGHFTPEQLECIATILKEKPDEPLP